MKVFTVFFAALLVFGASTTAMTQSMEKASSIKQSEQSITTEIREVTIFMNGAQIREGASVQLKEGENQFRISDLTAYMDPNSIIVDGNQNFSIMSVRHQVNYTLSKSSNLQVKAIMDSLEDAQFKQMELAGLKNVVQQEKSLLENNRKIGGENSTLVVEDLQDMANFFRKRFQELEYRWIELTDKEKLNNAEIARLQSQLNSMNARKGTNPSEVLITVLANKAVTTQLNFSYVVRNAGWYPVYDLRAEDINSPIELVYRAKVFQSTGRDWKRVNLIISTGNPTVGGQIPTLNPWYVSIYDQMAGNYGRGNMATRYSQAVPTEQDFQSKAAIEEAPANMVSMQVNTINTEFKIAVPYDIPSDNQQYDVIMQKQSLQAHYAHITIPKLDHDAFLRAQVVNWAQYSLLPGESNIYFNGTFVGKAYIDPAMANDTLNLSLGRDKAISVKREMIKEYCKTGVFGSKQHTLRAYEITVQNNKKQPTELIIEDQIPISQSGEVEVIIDETSGAQYDAQTGKLTWVVKLNPGEIAKRQIKFTVKYQKKKYIMGL